MLRQRQVYVFVPEYLNKCTVFIFKNIFSLPVNSKCYINATSAQMPYEHVFLLHQRTLFNYSVSPTIKIEKLFSTEKKGICEKIKNEARLKPLIKKSL